MEYGENSDAVRQLDMAGSRVNFRYQVGSRLFVVAFLHGATGLHILDIDKHLIPYGVYRGVLMALICVFFIALPSAE